MGELPLKNCIIFSMRRNLFCARQLPNNYSMTHGARIRQSLAFCLQSFGLAKSPPVKTVKGDESKAKHRDDETTRHIKFVCDIPHLLGQNRPTHNRHHDKGGSFLSSSPKSKNSESEYGWKHDRHEELTEEDAKH